jgi:hypothetical protein
MAAVPADATTLLAEMIRRLSTQTATTPKMDEDFTVPMLETSSY